MFRLTDHINRLFNSAKIFMIDVPFTPEEIVEATKATVRVNGLPECYIRPIVYLGYGEMGLNPLPCPVNVSIAVWPWGAYLGDGGHRQRRADEDQLLAAPRPQRHAAGGQRAPACTSTPRWPRSRPSRPATTRPSCCHRRAT